MHKISFVNNFGLLCQFCYNHVNTRSIRTNETAYHGESVEPRFRPYEENPVHERGEKEELFVSAGEKISEIKERERGAARSRAEYYRVHGNIHTGTL